MAIAQSLERSFFVGDICTALLHWRSTAIEAKPMRLLSTLIDIPNAFYRLWEKIHTPTLPNQSNPFEGLDPDRLLACKAKLEGQYQRIDPGCGSTCCCKS